ncbi:hypothetical protein QYM36_013361 [Artemia franciscana]|uniref:C2H2-type domain-containing protein n=1 Tax=Artemia franciscana TaxID=6661 RepID=A0AA88HE26_ARTSF|nr:hypothetical protein QYM36_013361 [Artemia franciscana]
MPGPRPYLPPRLVGYPNYPYNMYWQGPGNFISAAGNFPVRPVFFQSFEDNWNGGPVRHHRNYFRQKNVKKHQAEVKKPVENQSALNSKTPAAPPVTATPDTGAQTEKNEIAVTSGASATTPVLPKSKPEALFVACGPMKSFEDVIEEANFIGPVKPEQDTKGASTSVESITPKVVQPAVPASEKRKNPLYGIDDTWPDELIDKFTEFECNLCDSKMTSPLIAKTHYEGKVHQKKLRTFFFSYAQTTGMPIYYYLKRKKETISNIIASNGTTSNGTVLVLSEEAKAVPAETHELYCNICQIAFTSKVHKAQHEQGRNHQRKAVGLPPLKTGYFNPATGRWHKLPQRLTGELDKTQQNSFSANLVPLGGGGSAISGKTYETESGQKLKNLATLIPIDTNTTVKYIFECKLCSVTAPTQVQLDVHLNGQKHRTRLDQKERIEKQLELEKKGLRPKPYDRQRFTRKGKVHE